MNKEEKCISLPLAQELQKIAKKNKFELPESEHMWFNLANQEEKDKGIEKWEIIKIHDVERLGEYPALDTVELGVLLPERIRMKTHCMGKNGRGIDMELCFGVNGKYGKFWIAYGEKGIITDHNYFEAKTEAEARGQMFSYLIKNKLT